MNELLFAIFIITGFLLGTVLLGNLLYYSIYSLPRFISLKLQGNLKSPIPVFFKITYPLLMWLIITVLAVFIVFYFFSPYSKMFLSGTMISLIFILIDFIRKK